MQPTRSWRLSFAIALLFALSLPLAAVTAEAAAKPEKGKQCSDGIDNDGDGLVDDADPDCGGDGGGSGDSGSSTEFVVTVDLGFGGIVHANGAFDGGIVEETWLEKQQPLDPGADYWRGARMQNPPCCDFSTPGRTELQMVVSDVPDAPPAASCTAFFASHGGGNYDGSTWTGPGAISIYLDAGEGKGKPKNAPTWGDLGGDHAAKVQIIANSDNGDQWNLRFDDDWYPPRGAEAMRDAYVGFGITADDILASGDASGSNAAGAWTVQTALGNVAVVHMIGSPDVALCQVDILWTATRQ